jgi:ribonuclease HI
MEAHVSEAVPAEIFIHADESCLGNQFKARENPGGAGGLVEYWHGESCERRDFWVSEADTTNNRMALRSAIDSLRLLKRPCRVHFVSDSQYLVRGMTQWIQAWKARGWKRKGGPIENLDLWKELDRQAARHRVSWHWTRGHAGNARNEYANHLATRAAQEQDTSQGLVESGFSSWLEERREARGEFLEFYEHLRPTPET